MKKVACAVLILAMVIFLINPLFSDARDGSRGGHRGGGGAHRAVRGGATVLAPYYYPSYYYQPYYYSTDAYSPDYSPPPVVIQEQPPVYVQPAPSVLPSASERIFVYPRQGQSEKLQAKDHYECHRWAVSQTHYDPTQSTNSAAEVYIWVDEKGDKHITNQPPDTSTKMIGKETYKRDLPGGMSAAPLNQMRADYQRAMSACLDAHEYTVK
jgi:hypothetical protein